MQVLWWTGKCTPAALVPSEKRNRLRKLAKARKLNVDRPHRKLHHCPLTCRQLHVPLTATSFISSSSTVWRPPLLIWHICLTDFPTLTLTTFHFSSFKTNIYFFFNRATHNVHWNLNLNEYKLHFYTTNNMKKNHQSNE